MYHIVHPKQEKKRKKNRCGIDTRADDIAFFYALGTAVVAAATAIKATRVAARRAHSSWMRININV
jgi:hypothetical protein